MSRAASRVRVLVVDDEALARKAIAHLLAADADIVVVGEASDGAMAIEMIRTLAPDLVLLDVQMPIQTGIEVVREIGADNMPAVIFVTAHDAFAIEAFDINAVDYLLKPFTDERFFAAIARAKRSLRSVELDDLRRRLGGLLERGGGGRGSVPTDEYLDRLVIKSGGRSFFIRVDDIDWVEAADYYSKVHVAGKGHLIRETMNTIEAQLDPRQFFRVHRSAIVNLDRIVEMQPFFHGDYVAILRDGTRVKLTRNRREKLEAMLKQRI